MSVCAPGPHRIGVCSWSLHPQSPAELAERVRAAGMRGVQLHLDPIRLGKWSEPQTIGRLRAAGIEIYSGMMSMSGEDYTTLETIRNTGGVRPDATWTNNLDAARVNARLARRLGLSLVTFHAGFIPQQHGPDRDRMIDRLRQIVDVFDDAGVRVGFETGQETAQTLMETLTALDRPHAGVNFDPANMLLYGMGDPVAALSLLAPRVVQIHIKDAMPSPTPGVWGDETPAGNGAVDWTRLLRVVVQSGLGVDLLIERESGEKRFDDIRRARDLVRANLPGTT